MFSHLPDSPASHRLASVAMICVASALACVTLIACDAVAEHPREAVSVAPAAAAPVAHAPLGAPAALPASAGGAAPSNGPAALHDYRADLDPSHAAVASYRD